MLIDITVKVTPRLANDAQENEKKASFGHLGTHFDVMNKEFPLEFTELNAIVFDVSGACERDIDLGDIDLSKIEENMFVAFYSGFIESEGYGGKKYFTEHPQLSNELIDELLRRGISIIGIDFAGVRRGSEHVPKDQLCADNNVFVIENLCNLKSILCGKAYEKFTANTYPVNFAEVTGLPCRVIANTK